MRPRGGIIGATVQPTTTAASGMWTLREAEALTRAGTWPTAPTPPGVPTALSGSSGNAQVSLTWTAPASNGGLSITNYSVQYSSNSGSTWTTFSRTASATASQIVTGLTNGTAYVFRVAAINGVGTGAYTAASSSVTPSATFLTVSPASGTSDNGTAYYWSGSGTAASPLQTSDAAAPNGIDWGFAYGANTYRLWTFTCGVSGTLTVEFGAKDNDGPEFTDFVRYVRNGTLSTTFASAQTVVGTHAARRTLTVTAGDVIKLSSQTGDSFPSGGDWVVSSSSIKGKFRLWIS
ncbi:fibronectin type III domain-containing protein [bacterium]|nr:fibronectin type III domain-containing protein [bacterium]NDD85720.1 fibronectin type III domain-containing protein [bacterium]